MPTKPAKCCIFFLILPYISLSATSKLWLYYYCVFKQSEMQAIHFAAIGGDERIIEKLVKEYGVSPTVEVFMYVLLLAYTNINHLN